MLKIQTLGGLTINIDGQPAGSFVSRKAEALLVYLAMHPREHPREALSEMLWDDLSQSQSLSYLRTALSSLQKQLATYLRVSRYSIAINDDHDFVWVDARQLDTVLTEAELQWESRGVFAQPMIDGLETVLELYKGSFLQGFNVRNCSQFEDWMVLEQERLHSRVTDAHYRLGRYHLDRQSYASGIAQTTRVLQLDPYREEAHRLQMRLLAESGQRSAALAQYETCMRLLDEELGVEPDDETNALYERIAAGEIDAPDDTRAPTNLPVVGTPFVDRPRVRQAISSQLGRPHCRLLTLTGPGGVGKTRLALEVAREALADFRHGVYYVSFAGVREPERVLETIANSLDIGFSGDFSSQDDLVKYLRHRDILFVLDSFEAMAPSAGTLSEILGQAPGVKMLVTSRERLGVVEEWLFVVEGLTVPDDDDPQATTAPAVQLFVQSAQRMQPQFSVDANARSVIQICRATGGMPLAIELAASWVRMMSAEQILEEVERGLDFLSSSMRNVPERHQSVRAVFDSSWRLLPEAEQALFRRLSVFRGGFDRVAAEQVAGASVFALSALVDKSLLRPIDDRYEMHELLRQYGRDKLLEHADERQTIRAAHSHYFASFARHNQDQLSRTVVGGAFDRVIREIENIRAAWQYALEAGSADVLSQFLRPLYQIYDAQSNFKEAEELFARAADALRSWSGPESELAIARSQLFQGACNYRMDRYGTAENLLMAALPVLEAQDAAWEVRLCLQMLGNTARARGAYHRAQRHFLRCVELLEGVEDLPALAVNLNRLGSTALMLGQYDDARAYLTRGMSIVGEQDKFPRLSYLIAQGDLNVRVGRLAEAAADFQEALRLSNELDSRNNRAMLLADLAQALIGLGDYDQAKTLCRQSIDRNEEIHNRWGIAYGLLHLGKACLATGERVDALEHFARGIRTCEESGIQTIMASLYRQRARLYLLDGQTVLALADLKRSLDVAVRAEVPPLVLDALSGFAELSAAEADPMRAQQIAKRVLAEPQATHEARLAAQAVLDDCGDDSVDAPALDTIIAWSRDI